MNSVKTPANLRSTPMLSAFPEAAFRTWLKRRREAGHDRYDEVWDGVYVVSPIADIDHQRIGHRLASGIDSALNDHNAQVFQGTNISDRDDWRKNYRIPDVAVFLPGNPAQDRGTHWLGGPDFAVEIVSKGDRSHDKLAFYAGVGVRELLFVNRKPWSLELYRRDGGSWLLAGRSGPDASVLLESSVLPHSLRLTAAEPRPRLEILGRDGRGPWFA